MVILTLFCLLTIIWSIFSTNIGAFLRYKVTVKIYMYQREQDGGGVGGHEVHLSPQKNQEYTL